MNFTKVTDSGPASISTKFRQPADGRCTFLRNVSTNQIHCAMQGTTKQLNLQIVRLVCWLGGDKTRCMDCLQVKLSH